MSGTYIKCDFCGQEYAADILDIVQDFECERCGSTFFTNATENGRVSINASRELSRGIFWVLADTIEEIGTAEIFYMPIYCSRDGIPFEKETFNSKKGNSFNHKATWKMLSRETTKGKAFDYYPRGRVEIARNKATIWLNGNILSRVNDIKRLFGLNGAQIGTIQVKEDGSKHYECHFDW